MAAMFGFIWVTLWLWLAFPQPEGFLIWCAVVLLIISVGASAEIMEER
jgi:uncharacterized membrane protein YccC